MPVVSVNQPQTSTSKPIAPQTFLKSYCLVFLTIFLLVSGFLVFSYAYQQLVKENQKISQRNKELEEKQASLKEQPSVFIQSTEKTKETTTQECPDISGERAQWEQERDVLKQQINTLSSEVTTLKGKISKALAYNDFFIYLNSVVETHGGLDGITEAEYALGREKAVKTGDTNFVVLVEEAWKQQTVPQLVRLFAVCRAIAGGIENALK